VFEESHSVFDKLEKGEDSSRREPSTKGPKFAETEARAEAQPEPEAELPQHEVRVPRWYVETVRDYGVQEIAEPTSGPRRSQRLCQRGDTSQGVSVNFALMAKIEGET
jgi:hypothetical protein